MIDFKKKHYTVLRKVIDKELSSFLYNYSLLKRDVHKILTKTKYISPFEDMHGVLNDKQAPNTFSIYGDIAMETLLLRCHDVMEKNTGLNLFPNYAYMRTYKHGDILERHRDRYSCEISTTMNLGGDPWPIYLQPTGKKSIKITLGPGDMLIYKGDKQDHWREYFEGEICAQVFLHYNDSKKPGAKDNIYDSREYLGLPPYFKRK